MKKRNLLRLLWIGFSVTNIVNCTSNNDSKITTLPQVINQDTGLRELRFRRYDCLHLPDNETEEDCTNNEEIQIEDPIGNPKLAPTNLLPSAQPNLRVNELTPWLQNKARTIVNPSIMYNDLTEKVAATAYLRMYDSQNIQKSYKYTFEADLKSFRERFRKSGQREYLRLAKKESESKEIINAVIHCYDNPTCKDITLVFSFLNYDQQGKSFIDSRPFQLDQREEEIVATDSVPNKATRTLTDPILNVESDEEQDGNSGDNTGYNLDEEDTEEEDIDHTDEAFSRGPVGPVLPQDKQNSLCEGLTTGSEVCPSYLLDPSISRLPEEETGPDSLGLDEPIIKTSKEPTVNIIDEEVFPDEARVLQPEAPRLAEENIDLLPTKPVYDPNLYHQFILRLKIQKELALIDAHKNSGNQSETITTSNIQFPDPEDAPSTPSGASKSSIRPRARPKGLAHPSEDVEAQPVTKPIIRPRARPSNLNTNNKAVEKVTPVLAESEKEVPDDELPTEDNTAIALTDKRPRMRPEGLGENSSTVSFTSIDGHFVYDLGLCGDHLIKAKNIEYHQSRGYYSQKGSIINSTHFNRSDYDPNQHDKGKSNRHYSSEISKQVLEFSACVLEQRYGANLKIVLKSFSDHNGGHLSGHGSHQNGLDADVSYPHINGNTKGFDVFSNNMPDYRVAAAIDYARLLLYTDRVHVLFTDNKIRTRFCSYLKDKGKLSDYRNVVERYMYHISGHKNHYHVRIKCNPQNVGCVVQDDFADDNHCGQ